ncbi:MAG: hypothetical protein KF708_06100 [Pirellulales bacterium]|nr:hypothetical protein [Pirellulales bacterium]
MPRPLSFAPSRRELRLGWRSWLTLSAVAGLFLLLGLETLWQHGRSPDPSLYRAPSGVVLVLLALVQWHVLWRLYRCGGAADPRQLYWRPNFWQWMFAGAVLNYVAVLSLGEPHDVRYLFRAAVAAWYTASLLPLAAPRRFEKITVTLGERATMRSLGRLAFYILLLVASFEATLRLHTLVFDGRGPAAFVAQGLRLPPGSQHGGRNVNRHGYWDDEFVRATTPGVFRIAALGDGVTISGTAQTNYLELVEQSLPGVEIYNFGLPHAGPREYAAQLVHEVAGFRPGLVLVFLSVDDDITRELPLPDPFEWQGLRLYQTMTGALLPRTGRQLAEEESAERERRKAEALAVCRTPLGDEMRTRWDEALAHVNDLVEQCARRDLPCALVIVPGEFQLNDARCQSLARRAGYPLQELDLELPQRRIVGFAQERAVAHLDLLPYLRRAEQPVYAPQDGNWTSAGHLAAADSIRGWLTRQFGPLMTSHAQAAAY